MPTPATPVRVDLPDNDRVRALCGAHNEHLKLIEKRLGIQLGLRGGQLILGGGDPATLALAERLLRELYGLLEEGFPMRDLERVAAAGADLLWRETPVPHTIDPRVLPELQAFVASALA